MKKRKWKLFGSELQEQNLLCRGGVTWYKDVLIFPCKVKDKNTDEVRERERESKRGIGRCTSTIIHKRGIHVHAHIRKRYTLHKREVHIKYVIERYTCT